MSGLVNNLDTDHGLIILQYIGIRHLFRLRQLSREANWILRPGSRAACEILDWYNKQHGGFVNAKCDRIGCSGLGYHLSGSWLGSATVAELRSWHRHVTYGDLKSCNYLALRVAHKMGNLPAIQWLFHAAGCDGYPCLAPNTISMLATIAFVHGRTAIIMRMLASETIRSQVANAVLKSCGKLKGCQRILKTIGTFMPIPKMSPVIACSGGIVAGLLQPTLMRCEDLGRLIYNMYRARNQQALKRLFDFVLKYFLENPYAVHLSKSSGLYAFHIILTHGDVTDAKRCAEVYCLTTKEISAYSTLHAAEKSKKLAPLRFALRLGQYDRDLLSVMLVRSAKSTENFIEICEHIDFVRHELGCEYWRATKAVAGAKNINLLRWIVRKYACPEMVDANGILVMISLASSGLARDLIRAVGVDRCWAPALSMVVMRFMQTYNLRELRWIASWPANQFDPIIKAATDRCGSLFPYAMTDCERRHAASFEYLTDVRHRLAMRDRNRMS